MHEIRMPLPKRLRDRVRVSLGTGPGHAFRPVQCYTCLIKLSQLLSYGCLFKRSRVGNPKGGFATVPRGISRNGITAKGSRKVAGRFPAMLNQGGLFVNKPVQPNDEARHRSRFRGCEVAIALHFRSSRSTGIRSRICARRVQSSRSAMMSARAGERSLKSGG